VHAARGETLTNKRVRELAAVDAHAARDVLHRLRDQGFLEQHGQRGGASYRLLSSQKADPSATATYAPQPDWIAQKPSQSSIVSSGRGASSAPDNGDARSTTAREPSKTVDARLAGRLRPGCPEPLCTTDLLMP